MGMRKRFDCIFRKGFKSSKLKTMAKLAISRLAVLKNNRQARCSIARSDVVQILKLGNHERALLRVEQVIKDQNMVDLFVMLESYCHLMLERIILFDQENECHEDIKEAVSSLVHAASRCGDFPELQKIRKIVVSQYGKEFVARAVDLRNNCGVNPKMIQRFSTRMPSLDDKMKMLTEIAAENNIVLHLEQDSGKSNNQQNHVDGHMDRVEDLTESENTREKYKDVAHAAQAAFESAAYAAVAARAAVELSRSGASNPIVYGRATKESAIVDPKNEADTDSESEGTENFNETGFKRSSSSDGDVDLEELKQKSFNGGENESNPREKRDIMNAESDGDENEEIKIALSKSTDGVNARGGFFKPPIKPEPDSFSIHYGEKEIVDIEPLNIYRSPISVRNGGSGDW